MRKVARIRRPVRALARGENKERDFSAASDFDSPSPSSSSPCRDNERRVCSVSRDRSYRREMPREIRLSFASFSPPPPPAATPPRAHKYDYVRVYARARARERFCHPKKKGSAHAMGEMRTASGGSRRKREREREKETTTLCARIRERIQFLKGLSVYFQIARRAKEINVAARTTRPCYFPARLPPTEKVTMSSRLSAPCACVHRPLIQPERERERVSPENCGENRDGR